MNLELNEFCQPDGSKDSVSYPGGDKLCAERDTEASGAYIFRRAIHISNTSVNSKNREII
jgi:hypothetical protein